MPAAVPNLQSKSLTIQPRYDTFSATYAIDTPLTHETNHGSQTIHGRLNAKFAAESQEYFDSSGQNGRRTKRIVHVDLNGTSYGAPSNNILDQNDMRGFYVEWIRYRVWLQTPGAPVDPDNPAPAPDWFISKESPDTSNQTGSVSSSISWGFNASVGVFGDVPTASVGGNFGVSSSHSHALTDFTFYQYSTANILDHKIVMSMTGDGNPYSSTSDLFNTLQSPFVGVRLRPLTSLAKSNVPVIGQAVWMNDSDAGLVPKLQVCISIQPHWVLFEGSMDVKFHGAVDTASPTLHYTQDVDFTQLR